MSMVLAYLSKPLIIIMLVVALLGETIALAYCVPGWMSCATELKSANATIARLKEERAELVLAIQKQSNAIRLLQAQGETYKGQLAVAVKASEELKKRTARKVKDLESRNVASDTESIRLYLLEGRGD